MLAVYHATKAFVLSWSEALATELADTSVSVTTLRPGPVDTDFFPKADMIDTGAFQKGQVMPPQDVAAAAYAALMAGDRVVVPGAAKKALVFSRCVLPESTQGRMNENSTSAPIRRIGKASGAKSRPRPRRNEAGARPPRSGAGRRHLRFAFPAATAIATATMTPKTMKMVSMPMGSD